MPDRQPDVTADSMLIVRFSEVHWFEVNVRKGDLDEANGGRDCAGISGPTEDYPETVDELLSARLDATGRHVARVQVDGREVNGIRRAR